MTVRPSGPRIVRRNPAAASQDGRSGPPDPEPTPDPSGPFWTVLAAADRALDPGPDATPLQTVARSGCAVLVAAAIAVPWIVARAVARAAARPWRNVP